MPDRPSGWHPAFNTTPLGPGDWLVCVGLASVVLWADEATRLLLRLRLGSRALDPAQSRAQSFDEVSSVPSSCNA